MPSPRKLSLSSLFARQGGEERVRTIAGGAATDEQIDEAIVQAENEAEGPLLAGGLYDDEFFLDLLASATLYHLRVTLTVDVPEWVLSEKRRVDRHFVGRRIETENETVDVAAGATESGAARPARHRPTARGHRDRWLPGAHVR